MLVVLIDLPAMSSDPASSKSFVGLWEAKRYFGPEIRGTLTLVSRKSDWWAEIAGHSVKATVDKGKISFRIPGNRGEFKGRIEKNGAEIKGHWIQPQITTKGTVFASPVQFQSAARNRWRAEVVPLEDLWGDTIRLVPFGTPFLS